MLSVRLRPWIESSTLRLAFPSPYLRQQACLAPRVQRGSCVLRRPHGQSLQFNSSSRPLLFGNLSHWFTTLTAMAAQSTDVSSLPPLPADGSMPTTSQKGLISLLKQQNRSLVFATDFDSTCTDFDSSPILGELGIKASPENSRHKREVWNSLVETYMEAYENLLHPFTTTEALTRKHESDTVSDSLSPRFYSQNITIEGKGSVITTGRGGGEGAIFDSASLRTFLSHLAKFEVTMNKRVEDSGILKGISEDALDAAGREMPLRPFCASVLRQVASSGYDVKIISVSWSRRLIEGAIKNSLAGGPRADATLPCSILANDLEMESHFSTGKIKWRMQHALHKEKELGNVMSACVRQGGRQFRVYVGDSLTDLLALLLADVGIIIGNNGSLNRMMTLYGVETVPLSQVVTCPKDIIRRGSNEKHTTLYRVSTWEDIERFMFFTSL